MTEANDKGYVVEEVRGGLYSVSDGFFNTMFLVHDEGVVAVDAPLTLGENYPRAIEEVTDKPVTHVVYSHSHADHIGAANLFPEGATYVAQEETTKILREREDPRRPVPDVTFGDAHTLEVGGQTLELSYRGNNHQVGNIFIYAPAQRTLMLVDVVFPGWVPYKNLGVAQDVPGYIKAHDQALSYDFDTLVAGHVNRLGTRQDVETSKEYVTDLMAAAGAAFAATDLQDVAGRVGMDNPWELFDTFQDEVVQKCAEQMRSKWRGRLEGGDVYLDDHCWTMVESLNIDFAPPPGNG